MIIKLKDRALLEINGNDAQSFLQSQFTNDINLIDQNEVQVNAYCQHQGKIIALLWVFVKNDSFYLSFPQELRELVLSKLNMFKLMSEVDIEDISSQVNQYGLIGENLEGSMKLRNNLSLYTSREILESNFDSNLWEKACIDNNLPDIHLKTSEQFIPQVLNLDIDEIGVSFTKGCYPGQEVVARMHYLGKPKRRLFQFSSKSEANIGDLINVKGSKSIKSSGVILRVAKIDENYYSLGTFEIQHSSESVYLNNDINKPLTIIDAK